MVPPSPALTPVLMMTLFIAISPFGNDDRWCGVVAEEGCDERPGRWDEPSRRRRKRCRYKHIGRRCSVGSGAADEITAAGLDAGSDGDANLHWTLSFRIAASVRNTAAAMAL